tara:strand:+ start:324 stop:734 length:411 start_codon:yes stop_codon:yes gene_type:complete
MSKNYKHYAGNRIYSPGDIDELKSLNPEALLLEPREQFDNAYIGYATKGPKDPVACYEFSLIMDCLIDQDDMQEQDAVEHFDYNIRGSWLGDNTPVIMHLDEYALSIMQAGRRVFDENKAKEESNEHERRGATDTE